MTMLLEEEGKFLVRFRNPDSGATVRGIWARVLIVWYQSRDMVLGKCSCKYNVVFEIF